MLRPWQRVFACTAAALLALLVSGCEVRGTVDVKSATEAEVNLVFTRSEVDCIGLTRYAGLVIKGSPESDGNQTCRAQGTIDMAALKDFGIVLSQAGEYVTVDLALPQQFGNMPTQVDIGFPGRVVEDGGLPVSGTSVRLGDASGIATFSPVKVVALSHPGPDWWVIALAGGLVAGSGLTGVLILLWGRGRRLRSSLHLDAEPAPDPDASAPATDAPGPQRATVPPDGQPVAAMRDARYEALFAPPAAGTEAVAVRAPEPAAPSPPAPVAAEHRIWAPPEDRGDR